MAHSFADDSPVYLKIPAAAVQQFTECVELIDRWMQCNRLKLNTDKTQLTWMSTHQQLLKVNISEINLGKGLQSGSTSHPRQLEHRHGEGDLLRNRIFKVGLLRRNITGHFCIQHQQATESSKHTGSLGSRQSSKWTHHTCIEEIALAPGPEKNHLQDSHVDAQGQNNPATRLSCQPHKQLRTWTCPAFEQHGPLGSSSQQNCLGLSCVLGMCASHMEQSPLGH